MAIQNQDSSLSFADRPEEGFEAYRVLSKAAVLSLFFGLVSLASFLFPAFLLFAAIGVFCGIVAIRTIRRYPDEVSGWIPSLAGLILCSLIFVGGVTMHSVIYATEVPDGYQRVAFDALKSEALGPDIPPAEILPLDGEKVFIKGYIYPGGQTANLKRFVLVPDLGTCCFGGQPQLTHMIEVTLVDPLRVDYSVRKRKLAGTIRVDRSLKPVDGLGGVYYQLVADYVK